MSFLFEVLTREECEAIREQDGNYMGSRDTSLAIAKKIKDENYSIDQIIKLTELTKEEIEEL